MENPIHEFTATEVFQAFRRFMPEHAAWLAAEAATVDTDAFRSLPPVQPTGEGIATVTVPSVHFFGDALILLALVSEETAGKVERYREWLRRGLPSTPEEEQAWQTRRAELAAWRDQGYPRADVGREGPLRP